MRIRSSVPLVLLALLMACDGVDALALSLEVKAAKPDELELLVKSIPGAELVFDGQTKNTGEAPNASFSIPKAKLKLGKNDFVVEGTAGAFLGKKAGKATATYDAQPRDLLRFEASTPGAAAPGALTCTSPMCSAASFPITGTRVVLAVRSAIAATATIDGQKTNLAPGVKATVDVDLLPKLAAMPVGHDEVVTLPIVLEANGAKASETIELRGSALTELAATQLAKVEQGPVAFAGEASAKGEPDALVVIGIPNRPMLVVGKPGKLEDVDLVAIAKPAERFFGCGTGGSGITYVDLDVKVFDRRTGAVSLAAKKLLADRVPCPPTPTPGKLKGDVREDDVKRVLAELLKK